MHQTHYMRYDKYYYIAHIIYKTHNPKKGLKIRFAGVMGPQVWRQKLEPLGRELERVGREEERVREEAAVAEGEVQHQLQGLQRDVDQLSAIDHRLEQ